MMNLQPQLNNELISLRPLTAEDYDPVYEVAKDPLIWAHHPNSDRYKVDVFLEFFHDSIQSQGALVVIENVTNQIIGSSRYKLIPNASDAIEIGWSFLSRDKWGGKYNGAMKSLMIDHALESMEHIIFYIGQDNLRSQKAVEKLGGAIIKDESLRHLVKQGESDMTYRIGKFEWNRMKVGKKNET